MASRDSGGAGDHTYSREQHKGGKGKYGKWGVPPPGGIEGTYYYPTAEQGGKSWAPAGAHPSKGAAKGGKDSGPGRSKEWAAHEGYDSSADAGYDYASYPAPGNPEQHDYYWGGNPGSKPGGKKTSPPKLPPKSGPQNSKEYYDGGYATKGAGGHHEHGGGGSKRTAGGQHPADYYSHSRAGQQEQEYEAAEYNTALTQPDLSQYEDNFMSGMAGGHGQMSRGHGGSAESREAREERNAERQRNRAAAAAAERGNVERAAYGGSAAAGAATTAAATATTQQSSTKTSKNGGATAVKDSSKPESPLPEGWREAVDQKTGTKIF